MIAISHPSWDLCDAGSELHRDQIQKITQYIINTQNVQEGKLLGQV